MRKIILLLVCLSCSLATNAQRYMDMSIVVKTPADQDTVVGDTVLIQGDFFITNNGPDTIQIDDSFAFDIVMNGIMYPTFVLTNYFLKPGDTRNRVQNIGVISRAPGSLEFCFDVYSINAADTLYDTVQNNNKVCHSLIQVVEKTTINNVTLLKGIKLMPNPAHDHVKFEIELAQTENVSIQIMDMVGKVLISKEHYVSGAGNSNITVNTSNLPSGIYIYTVQAATQRATGRLKID